MIESREAPVAGRAAHGPLLAYFGHHKCASTWINDITREVCGGLGLAYANVHNVRMFGGDLPAYVRRHKLDFLSYSNARIDAVAPLSDVRAFHVIRDPRDIVVSSYFSHLYSHPTDDWPALAEHRAVLKRVDRSRGLIEVMDFLKTIDEIAEWDYSQPNVLEIKMEDLIADPETVLVRAFAFLGLVDSRPSVLRSLVKQAMFSARRRLPGLVPATPGTIPAGVLARTIRRNSFSSKAGGRSQGVEDVSSHYRKGVAGDWVNHFEPEHRDYFKRRYGDLLVRLGYETGASW